MTDRTNATRAREIARIRGLQARQAEIAAAALAREARSARARAAERQEVAQMTMEAWANALRHGRLDLAVIHAWPAVAAATTRDAERCEALVADAVLRMDAGLKAFASASVLAETSASEAVSAEADFRRRRDEKQMSGLVELLGARRVAR